MKKMKKFIPSLLALVLTISSGLPVFSQVTGTVTSQDGYAWPNAIPVTDTEEHFLVIGELNDEKTIVNSIEVTITDLPLSNYTVAYDEGTVERIGYDGQVKQTIVGEALSFADKTKSADNGWVMVDATKKPGQQSEAEKWVEVLNGNPAYVFDSSQSNIYSHTITDEYGNSYQAYNLADIAVASGGRGKDFGFKQVGGKWKNYTTYEATPRPTGWVKTDKKIYSFNETAQITAGGTDHSIYNNGIDSISLSVINKTTNKGYLQQVNTNTMSYVIKPEYGAGEYEVSYIMTDKHSRTTLDSPSMSTAKPITTTFTVGAAECPDLTYQGRNLQNGEVLLSPAAPTSMKFTSTSTGTWSIDGVEVANGVSSYTLGLPIGKAGARILLHFKPDNASADCEKTITIDVPGAAQDCDPSSPIKMDYLLQFNAASSFQDVASAVRLGSNQPTITIQQPGDTPYEKLVIATDGNYVKSGSGTYAEPGTWYIKTVSDPSAPYQRTTSTDYRDTALVLPSYELGTTYYVRYERDSDGKVWCGSIRVVDKAPVENGNCEEFDKAGIPYHNIPIEVKDNNSQVIQPNSTLTFDSYTDMTNFTNMTLYTERMVKLGDKFVNNSGGPDYYYPYGEWIHGKSPNIGEYLETESGKSKNQVDIFYGSDTYPIKTFASRYDPRKEELIQGQPNSFDLQDVIQRNESGKPGTYTIVVTNILDYKTCELVQHYDSKEPVITWHPIEQTYTFYVQIGVNKEPIAKLSATQENGLELERIEGTMPNRTIYYKLDLPESEFGDEFEWSEGRELLKPRVVTLINESYDQKDANQYATPAKDMTYLFDLDNNDQMVSGFYSIIVNSPDSVNPGVESRKIELSGSGRTEITLQVTSDKGSPPSSPPMASTNIAKIVIQVNIVIPSDHILKNQLLFDDYQDKQEVLWVTHKVLNLLPILRFENLPEVGPPPTNDKQRGSYYIPFIVDYNFKSFVTKLNPSTQQYEPITEESNAYEYNVAHNGHALMDEMNEYRFSDSTYYETYATANDGGVGPASYYPNITFNQEGTYQLQWWVKDEYGKASVSNALTVVIGPAQSCDDVTLTAKVNNQDKPLTQSSGDSSQYNLELVSSPGKTNKVDIHSLYNGAATNVSSSWVLKEGTSSKNIASGTGNPSSYTFTDTDIGTYTFYVTVKANALECTKKIVVNIQPLDCERSGVLVTIDNQNVSTSGGSESNDSPSTPLEYTIATGQNVNVLFKAMYKSDTTIKADYVLTKDSFTGTVIEKKLDSNEYTRLFHETANTTYYLTVTIKINGEACTKYYKILLQAQDCDAVYLIAAYDQAGDGNVVIKPNVNGMTIDIPQSTVSQLAVIGADQDNTEVGTAIVYADYTQSTKPNESADPGVYRLNNLTTGIYVIKAKINDSRYPASYGCEYTVTIKVGNPAPPPEPCTTCEPGGGLDGGKMKLKIYDSDHRLLTSADDGVWEREPARIEVEIDQAKIDAAFAKIDAEILKAIHDKKQEFLDKYQAPDYENVVVTPTPATWNSKTNPKTKWPSSVVLKVTGPGTAATFTLNPKLQTQSNVYTGTIAPTETTWNMVLNPQNYKAEVEDFTIDVDYEVTFDVKYDKCEMKPDPDFVPDPDNPDAVAPEIKECTPGTDTDTIQNSYTIMVTGNDQEFEVFEPNAKLTLHHTPEWSAIHAKDEHKSSTASSWYAGEAILTHINLEPRHKHPFSGKNPEILSATSWMREQGGVAAWMRRAHVKERPYWHQNSISLVKEMNTLWRGPKRDVPDPNHPGKYLLRNREKGVDNGVGRHDKKGPITMGDLWYGLQPGETYQVQGLVNFTFGVTKGYQAYDKNSGKGSQLVDYKSNIQIIDNALSRILNFTQMK